MRKLLALLLICGLAATMLTAFSKPINKMTASELLDLGEKYLLEMNYEQALVYFDKLIEVEPRNPRGYTGLALAYIGRGNADNAIDTLRGGVKELSDNTSFLNDAVGIFEKIIGDEPSNPDAYIGIVEVYVALGDSDKAIDLLEQGYEATSSDKIGSKIKDLLPVEATKWFVEPSIEADNIQPVITTGVYPLKAWGSSGLLL